MKSKNSKNRLSVMVLAWILLEVRAPNLNDLLYPGQEPGAGAPDLVPQQLLEAVLDAGPSTLPWCCKQFGWYPSQPRPIGRSRTGCCQGSWAARCSGSCSRPGVLFFIQELQCLVKPDLQGILGQNLALVAFVEVVTEVLVDTHPNCGFSYP